MSNATNELGRAPAQLVGGWEAGLLSLLIVLYLGGAIVNPAFFGSTEAFHAILRDTSRVAIIAVGMTFVIVNKDIDLSVGSTYGLVAVVFARLFAPSFLNLDVVTSVVLCLLLGALIGFLNGVLVTILKAPAFIATLTMLFIGRGFVLALTHGQSIYYPAKAKDFPLFFHLGETNALGFNNQILIFAIVAVIGAFVLARTRWGYETFATGGNEQAAIYAGIPTNWVRIRAYLISSLCAALAGLLSAAQDKGVTPLYGVSGELTVIAAVIIGGASILGGRGRVAGSCLGALLVVLLDKVLREGWPITRTIKIGDEEVTVNAIFSLPVGAVPVFLGLLLVIAVLIEPYLIRRQAASRLWAWLRGKPPPPAYEIGGVALEGVQTKGAMATDTALSATGLGKFLARRDSLAIILTVLLWLTGLALRPDYWWKSFQHVRHPAQLHRTGADHSRTYLRHCSWRHRPLRRGGFGARGKHRSLFPEGSRRGSDDGHSDGDACRHCRRACQCCRYGGFQITGIHCHTGYVLYRTRARRVVRGGPATHWLVGGI